MPIMTVDPKAEQEQIDRLKWWRADRDSKKVDAALNDLRSAVQEGRNVMEPSIACAHAGVTTGEWGGVLRRVFGEYRAPTGVGGAAGHAPGEEDALAPVRARVEAVSRRLGRRLKMLVPPAQPDVLAEAINRVLANPALAREMGRAGRRRVEAQFSWASIAERTEQVYAEAIDEFRRTSGD
jgi:hypothetical protein